MLLKMTLLKMTLLKCSAQVLILNLALLCSGAVILYGAALLRYRCSIRCSPVIHFPCREGRKEKTGCLEDIRSLT